MSVSPLIDLGGTMSHPAMTPLTTTLSSNAASDNEHAFGLGQCLEALRLISALPRASPAPNTWQGTVPSRSSSRVSIPDSMGNQR